MKEWKTIGTAVVVTLLVAAIGLMAWNGREVTASQDEQALSNLKSRIRQFTVLKVEQTLMRDILLLQQEIRELQSKAQVSVPVNRPARALPPETREQE